LNCEVLAAPSWEASGGPGISEGDGVVTGKILFVMCSNIQQNNNVLKSDNKTAKNIYIE